VSTASRIPPRPQSTQTRSRHTESVELRSRGNDDLVGERLQQPISASNRFLLQRSETLDLRFVLVAHLLHRLPLRVPQAVRLRTCVRLFSQWSEDTEKRRLEHRPKMTAILSRRCRIRAGVALA